MDVLLQFLENHQIGTVIVAVGLLILTATIAHHATYLTRHMLSSDGKPAPKGSLAENIVRGLVWATGASLILAHCFKVDVDGLIAALGVGGIALSLGFQDTLSNIIGGIQITWLEIIGLGDHVIIGGIEGIVENVTWRNTMLRDFERVLHVIPNSVINSSTVDKFVPANLVTTEVDFLICDGDLDEMVAEAERLARDAVSKVAELKRDPWITLSCVSDGGCVIGTMRFVLKKVDHVREARDAALRAILPYTQQDPAAARGNSAPIAPIPNPQPQPQS